MSFRKQYLLTLGWIIFLMILALLTPKLAKAQQPLVFMQGHSASNSATPIVHSKAYAMSQDWDHLRVGYLNEGHLRELKRDGIFFQWVGRHYVTNRFAVEAQVGPYITATTTGTNGYWKDDYALAVLGGLGLRLDLSDHWNLALRWDRPTFTTNRKDDDVFLIGLGYR